MRPKTAEKIQNKIYSNMSSKRKIKIVSDFILLAKKLKEAENYKPKRNKK